MTTVHSITATQKKTVDGASKKIGEADVLQVEI